MFLYVTLRNPPSLSSSPPPALIFKFTDTERIKLRHEKTKTKQHEKEEQGEEKRNEMK